MAATAPSETEGRLAGQLRAVVAEACADPDAQVRDLRRLSGGASRETWAFDAILGEGAERPLVLRRDPPGAARGGGAMAREAAAIEAAARAGVPVPRVVARGSDSAALGAPFIVMDRIEGETVPRRILREEAYADARPRLAEQCGEILARVHAVPPGEVEGLEAPDALGQLRGALDFFEESPAFELGMRWLERNRPEVDAAVVVHGDFRNGNLMVGPDGIRAVLDWELVHRGDPMEDLGYLCARCWRFGAVDRPVGGFGDYADLFRGYERASGRHVDPELVRWWELFSSLWWGVGCMVQASRHLSGSTRSVELAAVGRRVREQEYDVLLYLDSRREG